jgi:hypothetical protein
VGRQPDPVGGCKGRRTGVVRIPPIEEPLICLVRAFPLDQNDEWAVQRGPYMTPETIAPLSDNAIVRLSATTP